MSPKEKTDYDSFKEHEIYIFDEIDSHIAKRVIKALKYFARRFDKQSITIYLHTPGGCVNSAMAIVDELNITKKSKTIVTVAVGEVASAGIFILAAGDKRIAYENSTFLIHPFVYSSDEKSSQSHYDAVAYMKFNEEQYKCIMADLLIACGKKDKLKTELNKLKDSLYLNAKDAIEYGLIHEIWTNENSK